MGIEYLVSFVSFIPVLPGIRELAHRQGTEFRSTVDEGRAGQF